jgi:cell division protein FtsQ
MIRRFLAAVSGVAVLALFAYVWPALDRPIRTVIVAGEPTQAERLGIQTSMSKIELGGILTTDLDEVERQLRTMGWTRQVMVRRQWPDRLEVRLHKVVPVAKWGDDDYLAANGDPLQLPSEYPNLPALSAHISSPQQTMELYRLLQLFAARQGLTIMTLAESPQGEWEVGFENGMDLKLGGSDVNGRMQRFLRAYGIALKSRPQRIEYVDARYTNGIAVRFGLHQNGSADASGPLLGMATQLLRTHTNDNGS